MMSCMVPTCKVPWEGCQMHIAGSTLLRNWDAVFAEKLGCCFAAAAEVPLPQGMSEHAVEVLLH